MTVPIFHIRADEDLHPELVIERNPSTSIFAVAELIGGSHVRVVEEDGPGELRPDAGGEC